jgi:hypothetical protein
MRRATGFESTSLAIEPLAKSVDQRLAAGEAH